MHNETQNAASATDGKKAQQIRVIAKEVSDYGDATCGCCGRAHRKMHRMSNGAVMGERCAALIERITDSFGGAQAARFLRASHPASPALRFVEGA